MKNNNTKTSIRLGIFVSAAIVIFIVALYFIGKRQQLFSNTFKVSGMFRDVNGLQVGNNVRFAGINVGIIEDITITTDTSVKVDFSINESTRKFIKKDAKAIIGTEGLMGNKIIIITSGTSSTKIIQNNDVILTTIPVSIDDIMNNLKITSDNAAVLTEDLADIFENIKTGRGTIGKLFMDTTFAENLSQSIVNIKKGTGGFSQNMEAAKHNILLRGFFKNKEKTKENNKTKKDEEKTKENDKTKTQIDKSKESAKSTTEPK